MALTKAETIVNIPINDLEEILRHPKNFMDREQKYNQEFVGAIMGLINFYRDIENDLHIFESERTEIKDNIQYGILPLIEVRSPDRELV